MIIVDHSTVLLWCSAKRSDLLSAFPPFQEMRLVSEPKAPNGRRYAIEVGTSSLPASAHSNSNNAPASAVKMPRRIVSEFTCAIE